MPNHASQVTERRVDPELLFDPAVFEEEQKQIFGRCWIFLAHETQIPNPGDYVSANIGNDPVIVWRGRDGVVRAFINSCTHRGMKVCRVAKGNAMGLTCPYHAWRFNSDGRLVGLPSKERYPAEFPMDKWGLIPVPKLTNYGGFIFGCLDENAGSFEEYLGEFKYYFDIIVKRTKAGYRMLPGRQNWHMDLNWKLASEQLSGDNYHAPYSHQSIAVMGMLGDLKEFAKRGIENDFQVSEKGHGLIVLDHPTPPGAPEGFTAYEAQVARDAAERLSPEQARLTNSGLVMNLFPNICFIFYLGGMSMRFIQPISVNETEVNFYAMTDAEAPEWRSALSLREVGRSYNALGIIDSDDAEMWVGCQEGLKGQYRRKFPLNYDLGRTTAHREPGRPGRIDDTPSEVGVFGFWEQWQSMMRGKVLQEVE